MAARKRRDEPDWQEIVMTAALVAGAVIVVAVVAQTILAQYQLLAPADETEDAGDD